MSERPWIIAISGASGIAYGRRLIQALLEDEPTQKIDVVVSEAALRVIREEEGSPAVVGRIDVETLVGFKAPNVKIHSNRDIGASIASGSYLTSGMVIVPCSMKTLAGVASGFCDNLILRAADVVIKENRKLIMVPRETPLSAIHLENMLKLSKIGVSMVPAMPGFYTKPESIDEIIDLMVMKILDQMGVTNSLVSRWKSEEESKDKVNFGK